MGFVYTIVTAATGLVFGSFLSAFTYRWPRGISIRRGRSVCPKCKKNIAWYDNIPLLSYLLLSGRCRNCKKRISIRYPLIEFFTALIFVLVFYLFTNCATTLKGGSLQGDIVCKWGLPYFSVLPLKIIFFWVLSFCLIGIFVIDLEKRLIPDEFVFWPYFLTLLVMLDNSQLYKYLFSGFAAALFLLMLNLITRGRGMGLGDVKLALLGGTLLGFELTVVWLMLSFITGAVVGSVLIIMGRAKFGKQIAFGPFLVFCLFVVLLFGETAARLLLPINLL